MTRPLWQLLMRSYNTGHGESLTCDECFVVLQYYADQLTTGIDPDTLSQSAHHHLDRCPECHEDFVNRLDRLKEDPH